MNFPPNVFSLFFFFSTLFLLFSSFFFVFIYLFICFLSLTFHLWFVLFFLTFVFSLLLFISGHILLLCYFSFFTFLFLLSVFGRSRSFGIPETSYGSSNPEIHSLLTFMSLRSNRNEATWCGNGSCIIDQGIWYILKVSIYGAHLYN